MSERETTQQIDAGGDWVFYVVRIPSRPPFICRADVFSTGYSGKRRYLAIHFTSYVKTHKISSFLLEKEERAMTHGLIRSGMICYTVVDMINILRALVPKVPGSVVDALEKNFFSENSTKKRKREEIEETPIPDLWPGNKVEYGNFMRVIMGPTKTDFSLPPVSHKIELFELPRGHPAYGMHSSLGVRAKEDILKGEILCHYAGIIEPCVNNNLPNLYVMHDADGNEQVQHNALLLGNEARFINAYNNTGKPANVAYGDFSSLGGTRRTEYVTSCQVVAIKDIKKGEELLVDYGEPYWEHVTSEEKKEEKISEFRILRRSYNSKEAFCEYVQGNKKVQTNLTLLQYQEIMQKMYPQYKPGTVVEVKRMWHGNVVKELCFFKEFPICDFPSAIVSPYRLAGFKETHPLSRISLPHQKNPVFQLHAGDNVYVSPKWKTFKMATVVSADNVKREAKVQIIGNVDMMTLSPKICTLTYDKIFRK